MLTKSNKLKLTALVDQALSKCKDRPDLLKELQEIKIALQTPFSFKINTSEEDFKYVDEVIERLETLIKKYATSIDVNDIESLENVKKEVSVNLMYLSSFKDKFNYEIEYLEDVFKKEIFSKLAADISLKEGISLTQAEKKVHLDEGYNTLRHELSVLKTRMIFVKTKYDFFSKMVQVIVQSISVAGKEHYNSRAAN